MKTPAFDVLLSYTVDRDKTPAAFALTGKLIDTTGDQPVVISESEEFANMVLALGWIQTAVGEFAERAGLIPETSN